MTGYEMQVAYLSRAVLIAGLLIGGYCFFLLAKAFMDSKIRAACAGAAYFFAMLALYVAPWQVTNFTAYGLGVFFAFIVACLGERKNYGQKAFLATVFFSLHWFAYVVTDILRDKLYEAVLSTDYMAAHLDQWFAAHVLFCAFWLASYFAFLAVSIKIISKKCGHKDEELSVKELLILTIPSVMGVLGFESMWHYRAAYMAQAGKVSDIHDAMAVFYCVAAVIATLVVIVLYQGVKERQEEKTRAGLLAAQAEGVRRRVEQAENMYQDIRGIRHDMTNHIITLERLYAANKTEEAKDYAEGLKEALAEAAGDINSGNPVTDVILREMKSGAEKKEIRFDMDFHYPSGFRVNAFDVSVILNNALQNALENAGEGEASYISVLSYRRNNAYMIEIRNSFAGSLRWDTKKELPVTKKGKTDRHGYGLANIRKVAGKYSGDIDIAVMDGEFCLSVMLMLE